MGGFIGKISKLRFTIGIVLFFGHEKKAGVL